MAMSGTLPHPSTQYNPSQVHCYIHVNELSQFEKDKSDRSHKVNRFDSYHRMEKWCGTRRSGGRIGCPVLHRDPDRRSSNKTTKIWQTLSKANPQVVVSKREVFQNFLFQESYSLPPHHIRPPSLRMTRGQRRRRRQRRPRRHNCRPPEVHPKETGTMNTLLMWLNEFNVI